MARMGSQFYLPPAHEPNLPLHPSRKASSPIVEMLRGVTLQNEITLLL